MAAHDIEIRAVAPELRDLVPARRVTLDADLTDDERILVPAPRRTLRLANGIAEFVRDAVPPGRALAVCNGAQADPTDVELLDVLMRRIPPAVLAITVYPGGPEPPPGLPRRRRALGDRRPRRTREGSCTRWPSSARAGWR